MTEQPTAKATETLKVEQGDIPLPPPEMWTELGGETSAVSSEGAAKGSSRMSIEQEVAALEFVGETKPFRTVPLTFPFRWNGIVHKAIVVRRMTVRQLIDFWDGLPDDRTYDRIDAYAVMCDLPAAVLRALPDVDGLAVNGACLDFLPRELGGGVD